MPSISQAVRSIIESRPILYEIIAQGIVNYAALAETLEPQIEMELGNPVELPAIIMAIRRYALKIQPLEDLKIPFKFNSEIIMKTGLVDITIVKTPSGLSSLKQILDLVDYDKGETLNIIQGNYEVTIVISQKYLQKIKDILKDEKIENTEKDLVSITMSFSKDFLYTPGSLAKATRKLAWENINIFENISTMTELIFIISKKDSLRAYKALQELVESN